MNSLLTPENEELVRRFFIFCLIGGSCAIIDFGLTYLSKDVFKTSKYIANAFGFSVSATINFFLNRNFTFQNHDVHVMQQFVKFIIVASIGLAINTGIIYLAQNKLNQKFYFAKVMATGVVLFWNFFINRMITFKQ